MDGAFVRQLVRAFAGLGVMCTVIHPQPLHRARLASARVNARISTGQGEIVYRPWYLSMSSKRIAGFNLGLLTQRMFEAAVWRSIRQQKLEFDGIYGHFLYLSGAVATRIGKACGKPSFVGVGESYLSQFDADKITCVRRDFAGTTGFVAVSAANKAFLVSQVGLPPERVEVFNNGVDLTQFYPRDRLAMRRALGIPEALFVVAFVGYFDQRKGVQRVVEAIRDLEHTGALFIGSGPLQPATEKALFTGQIPHAQVPDFLSAADVFVLPTLAEGCSNAILEAMACGLPIVSSKGEFNKDILTETAAIRIDPLNIVEIREAIRTLRDDLALRERMSAAALQQGRRFDVNERACRILKWMEKFHAGDLPL